MAAGNLRSVSVERVIGASPERIFAVLTDPAGQAAVDGSGMVQRASDEIGSTRLSLGSEFGMAMRWGVPYSMVNEVVEFEEGRRIAWRPRLAQPRGLARRFGGHVWRYELEPAGAGTRVTESYDWSGANAVTRAYIRAARWPDRARRAMERTLERLGAHLTGG